ncbi:MAG: hypothetical protein DCC49_11880, partial [Acidobacteria bacterium]
RILDSARRLFAEQGFDKTTIKDVALDADITTGAIYHYFDSKQALFRAVTDEVQQAFLKAFGDAIGKSESFLGRLRAVSEAAVALNDRDSSTAGFIAVMPIEMRRHPEFEDDVARRTSVTITLFESIVDEAKDRGEIASDANTRAVANLILATTMGLALFSTLDRERSTYRDASDAYIRLAEGTLFVPDRKTSVGN